MVELRSVNKDPCKAKTDSVRPQGWRSCGVGLAMTQEPLFPLETLPINVVKHTTALATSVVGKRVLARE